MKCLFNIKPEVGYRIIDALSDLIFTLNTPEKVDIAIRELHPRPLAGISSAASTLVHDAIRDVYLQIPSYHDVGLDVHKELNRRLIDFVRPLGTWKSCMFAQLGLQYDYCDSESNDGYTQFEKVAISNFIGLSDSILEYISVIFPHVRKDAVSRSAKSPESPSDRQ